MPNFFSLRQNFTRSLDCFAGKLKSKNNQEPDAEGDTAVSVCNTCDLDRFILIGVPLKETQSSTSAVVGRFLFFDGLKASVEQNVVDDL